MFAFDSSALISNGEVSVSVTSSCCSGGTSVAKSFVAVDPFSFVSTSVAPFVTFSVS